MEHTPGPWKVNKRKGMAGRYQKYNISAKHYSKPGILDGRDSIAEVNNNPESEANTYLMAAAPDLLEEHKALVARVKTMASALISKGLGIWVNDWLSDDILDGKAISKAEGS